MGARAGVNNKKGEKSREVILSTARRIFSNKGYGAVTMAAIASEMGLTQAGLQYHFSTKESILREILDEHFAVGNASLDGYQGLDILEGILAIVKRNSVNSEWAQLYSVLLGESVTPGHPARDFMKERFARIENLLSGVLRAGVSRGEIGPDVDVRALARVITAITDGLQFQWLISDNFDISSDFEVAAALIRRALHEASPSHFVAPAVLGADLGDAAVTGRPSR